MGFFDNLLAPFNTDAQTQAAQAQQAGLSSGLAALQPQLAAGRSALGTSLANSTNAFNTSLNNSTNAANTSLANSTNAWQPLTNASTGGVNAYADATGANGAAGNARAVNNFQAGPAYQFNMNQMLQNLARMQQMNGQGNSGATNVDTLNQASGLANNQWQQYVSNLSPFLNTSAAAASGVTGANANTAGLINNANANTASGLNLANMNAGNQTNQNYTTAGNAAYGTQAGIGNAQANADLAPLTAGNNIWNLIGGAAGGSSGAAGQNSNQNGNAFANAGKAGSSLFSSLAGFFA
jgi:hypothetical protein